MIDLKENKMLEYFDIKYLGIALSKLVKLIYLNLNLIILCYLI